jgi:parallel beta-helix repeat protein
VIDNHAYNTDDNGISITGYNNTVTTNVCRNNGGSGIWIYGSNNTVTGNVCSNNGQDFVNRAGILIEGGSGGQGKNNTVAGNVCFDDQGSPTQKWSVRLGANAYSQWTTSTSYTADASYVYFGNNVYLATTSGISGGSSPVHTNGTASDGGVTWLFLFTTTTSFHPTGNEVGPNVAFGNLTADQSDGATSGTNTFHVLGQLNVSGTATAGALVSPTHTGGATTTSTLTLQSTSGVGTTGADIIFKVGNAGATEAMRILNSGNVGINQSAPDSQLHVVRTNSANPTNILALQNSATATDTAARMNFVLSTSASATLAYIEGRRTNSPAGQASAIIFASHDGTSLAERMRMTPKGVLSINATTTAGGTTGNQTIKC